MHATELPAVFVTSEEARSVCTRGMWHRWALGFYGEWSEELAKVPTMRVADAQIATAAGGRVNMGDSDPND